MWRLNRITAKNLCAFKELDYTLTQGVTTLIFGDNRDNESQRSNGSGKSALLESIAVGITGSPLRKIRNEEIINDSADECFVCLEFTNTSSSEVFTVERTIPRKGASVVTCSDGVQHSVEAYNKHILEKLGITREELFNNFLLSKHKYSEFLSVSDKDKKEVINRFSNGVLVDDAIAKIEVDIEPLQDELREQELEFASIEGRIQMLTEQIVTERSTRREQAATKKDRIAAIAAAITAKRAEIRGKEQEISSLAESKTEVSERDKRLQALENSEDSIEEVLEQVKFELSTYGTLSDWMQVIAGIKSKIGREQLRLTQQNEAYAQASTLLTSVRENFETLQTEYDTFTETYKLSNAKFETQIAALDSEITKLEEDFHTSLSRKRTLSNSIESLKTKLAGVITCPKCEHQFILTDSNFDVECAKSELSTLQVELESDKAKRDSLQDEISTKETKRQKLTTERRELTNERTEWIDDISMAETQVRDAKYNIQRIEREQKSITDKIDALQSECDGVRRKIFDEAFEIIDRTNTANDRGVKKCREDIAALESSIETLLNTKAEIETSSPDELLEKLKASLKETRANSNAALNAKIKKEEQLQILRGQSQRFLEFKSFLANTKIEALSKITNEFLESIGSDIRICFSGYTKLKNGKIREKISISLLRDGIDCGSFGKFSEGEKARVNLSTILAMQKLINANCEDDKGLDLLVLDEILAAVDEEGNTMMFNSLNKLGITALVVSHGLTNESYPHTLTIRKEGNESRIV